MSDDATTTLWHHGAAAGSGHGSELGAPVALLWLVGGSKGALWAKSGGYRFLHSAPLSVRNYRYNRTMPGCIFSPYSHTRARDLYSKKGLPPGRWLKQHYSCWKAPSGKLRRTPPPPGRAQ